MKSKTVELKLIQNDGTEFMYTMRTMEDEKGGSDEMLRRFAFKEGYYKASLVLSLRRDGEEAEAQSLDSFIPKAGAKSGDFRGEFQMAYYLEGYALGLACSDKHNGPKGVPWGQLTCNGGTPLLPLLSDRLDLFPEDLRV